MEAKFSQDIVVENDVTPIVKKGTTKKKDASVADITGKTSADKTAVSKSTASKATVSKSVDKAAIVDKVVVDKAVVDKAAVDKTAVDKVVDKVVVDKVAVDKVAVDKSAVDKPTVDTTEVAKKKTNETDGYKKIHNIITTANSKFSEDIQMQVKTDLQEFKNAIISMVPLPNKASNDGGELLSKIVEMISKIDDKLNNFIDQQNFHNLWIKCAIESELHKNDVDLDIKPVIKGDVKLTVAKKAATKVASIDISAVKGTNFLKYQVLHDSEYILQLFNNKEYEVHITNCICEHIKTLPIASSFNKDTTISEKIEFFTNYVKSNDSASTKLFTLLNKNNATFKKSVLSDFESWKSQNTVNVNKDFLDGGEVL